MHGRRESRRSELLRPRDISFSLPDEHGEEPVGHHPHFRRRERLAPRRRDYRDRLRVKRRDWRYVDRHRT